MTPMRKLIVAAHVAGMAAPTAALSFIEYESHPGAVAMTATLLAGAAALVAVSAADQHAEEAARLAALAASAPPAPETAPDRHAAEFEAYDQMRERPPTQAPGPVRPEPDPAAEPSPTEITAADMAPTHGTHKMPPVPEAPPVAPDAPWSPTGLEFMRVVAEPARPPRHAAASGEDLYAHPELGDTTIGYFTAAADRQARVRGAA